MIKDKVSGMILSEKLSELESEYDISGGEGQSLRDRITKLEEA